MNLHDYTKCQTFKSVNYSNNLLSQFYQLWLRQEFTDLQFIICDKIYHVHRFLIQICSPYFNSLLSRNLKEARDSVIELHEVSATTFELLLNYVYTGSIKVDSINVYDILVAADYFGFIEISQFCCEFIIENLNEYNAIETYEFFNSYLLNSYAVRVKQYLCKNYAKLIENDEIFQNISIDLLYDLLVDDNLCVNSEFEIFSSVVKWLQFDYDNRSIYFNQLFQQVHVSCIKSIKLINYLNNNVKSAQLKLAIANYLYSQYSDDTQIGTKFLISRKYLRHSIIIFGGLTNALTNKVNPSVYNFDTLNLKLFPIMSLNFSRSNHSTCELNDLVFVAGGEIDSCIHNSVEIYDVDYFRKLIKSYYLNPVNLLNYVQNEVETDVDADTNASEDSFDEVENEEVNTDHNLTSINNVAAVNASFITLHEMTEGRTDFGLAAIEDRVFAFGGWIGFELDSSIEYYSLNENKWFKISNRLTQPRYEFACIALSNSNFIYLIGGSTPYEMKLTLVERFEIDSLSWRICASMREKRSGCACVELNEKIYVIGGSDGERALKTAEMYDPLKDRWYSIKPMHYNRYGCTACAVENFIYVFGGINNLKSKKLVNLIEYYDSSINEWLIVDKLKLNLFKATSIVI